MKYGRLTVTDKFIVKHGRKSYLTICDCGKEKYNFLADLRAGRVKSCGCFRNEQNLKRSTKHNQANSKGATRAYSTYHSMLDRCYNEKCSMYHRYGGRGIVVSERWKNDFKKFFEDMGEPLAGMSLDRVDNDGPYSKENCKWSTVAEQSRNRSTNIFVFFNGEKQILKDAAILADVNYRHANKLIKNGMSFDEAVAYIKRPRIK